jgi:hypothetical protein
VVQGECEASERVWAGAGAIAAWWLLRRQGRFVRDEVRMKTMPIESKLLESSEV